jgi:aryl-alcohol dehydrogenase-like predicted oxidoreductase
METIKIPHTDLDVSRLALGCMGLGGGWAADTQLTKDHERQARQFFDTAGEIGGSFFDHANIYGRGRAEEVFGRVLKERPSLRDKIVIQSKCGVRWADDPPGTPQRFDALKNDEAFMASGEYAPPMELIGTKPPLL